MERPLIVFDVNETLLDLQYVTPILGRIFGDEGVMQLWFANLVLYSCALTLADHYVPFTDIGAAVMEMLAKTRGIEIAPADKKELTRAFSEMPPYAEVPDALDRLRAVGFRLFTLTNNLVEVQTHQLTRGGIVDRFEHLFSVDSVRRQKPAREVYAHVVRELGASPSQMLLVACHTWDTLGAVAAGWQAALIRRPGNDMLGVGPQPQFVGDSLSAIVDQLAERYAS